MKNMPRIPWMALTLALVSTPGLAPVAAHALELRALSGKEDRLVHGSLRPTPYQRKRFAPQ